jgi:hypothetical protein
MDRDTAVGNNNKENLDYVGVLENLRTKNELTLQDWDTLANLAKNNIPDVVGIVMKHIDSLASMCEAISNKDKRDVNDWDFLISVVNYLDLISQKLLIKEEDKNRIENVIQKAFVTVRKDSKEIVKLLTSYLEEKTLSKDKWDFVVTCVKSIRVGDGVRNSASYCIREKIVKPLVSEFLSTNKIIGTPYWANYYNQENYTEDLIQAGWLASFLAATKYNRFDERNASFSTYAYMEVKNAVQQLYLKTITPVAVHYEYDEDAGRYLPDKNVQTVYLSSYARAKNQETDTQMEELIGFEEVDYLLKGASEEVRVFFIKSFIKFLKDSGDKELLRIIFYITSGSKISLVDAERFLSISRSRIDFLLREAVRKWKKQITDKMLLQKMEEEVKKFKEKD